MKAYMALIGWGMVRLHLIHMETCSIICQCTFFVHCVTYQHYIGVQTAVQHGKKETLHTKKPFIDAKVMRTHVRNLFIAARHTAKPLNNVYTNDKRISTTNTQNKCNMSKNVNTLCILKLSCRLCVRKWIVFYEQGYHYFAFTSVSW